MVTERRQRVKINIVETKNIVRKRSDIYSIESNSVEIYGRERERIVRNRIEIKSRDIE